MKEKIFDVDFVCPDCGHTILEEKRERVISYTEIVSFHQEDNDTYVGRIGEIELVHNVSEVSGYLCPQCQHMVATDAREALEWLKEHDMLEETK